MNEIVKKLDQPVDGFAAFDLSIGEGDTDHHSNTRLVGTRVKFTNEARWETREGTDISGRQLLITNLRRTEVKWGDGGPPIDVIEIGPGARYRDLNALNETIPKSEWRRGRSGKLEGPWKQQHVVEFVDLASMERFSWPTDTVGGTRAITDLRDRVLMMRRFRGADVYPTVTLSDTFMPTQHGGRQRPHLLIQSWARAGGENVAVSSPEGTPQLPAPAATAAPEPVETTALPDTTTAPTVQTPTPRPAKAAKTKTKGSIAATMQPVAEVTVQEELNDKIPF